MKEELNNWYYWEELVARIRGWDRMEHNWACSNKEMESDNLKTKEYFIKELMRDYELKRRRKMTCQEFYETNFLVNGKKPPPLTEFDKKIMAAYDNLKEGEQIVYIKGRQRNMYLIIKSIQENGQTNETNT